MEALLDSDLVDLAAHAGEPFTRALTQAERAVFADSGRPIPRHDCRRWRVKVHPHGPDAVRRVLYRDGRAVAELIDEPMPGGAR